MTITELLLLAATFVAICAAIYWHKRWSNAHWAELSASRKISALQNENLELRVYRDNKEHRIARRAGL